MTAHIHLGLVFHQHQPVGNYHFVFEELFQKSYDPLVSALERHPGVKAGLHFSGPLLDWLGAHRPGYLERLKSLVARGQVELLGGGYYEPILPALSDADRVGQMVKMRTTLRERFGVTARGMWLTERVWEPGLPASIAAAGYEWTVVDDAHFEAVGIRSSDLRGWYLTEDQGATMAIYGSDTTFRYLVPWGMVDDCIRYLGAAGDRSPGSLVVMGDDGEKFGGWPTTYEHCWEEGWVDRFFARLEAESDWLETVLLSDWRATRRAEGPIYLPATSYMEMGEWSLPPEAQHRMHEAMEALSSGGRKDLVPFLRGGHWRNFLVRYPEVRLLHSRLLELSHRAHNAGNVPAIEECWQAQCNCPWWHGVFGGVYLAHIRDANFTHLAAADAALAPGKREPDVHDWDLDGEDEICLRSERFLAIVDGRGGGQLQHLELREPAWHLAHVVARRPEAYHDRLSRDEDGAVRSIHDSIRLADEAAAAVLNVYDRAPRLLMQQTWLEPGATFADFQALRGTADAADGDLTVQGSDTVCVTASGPRGPVSTKVRVADSVTVSIGIPAETSCFSDWNLSLPYHADGRPPAFDLRDDELLITTGAWSLHVVHNADGVDVSEIQTAANTEGGVMLQPQGWAVVFRRECGAEPGTLELEWTLV